MKTSSIVFFSLIVSFLSINAAAQNKAVIPSNSGLLWEVSGKGLKEPSYLFGTYHLVGKNFLDTLPAITGYLKKAGTVVGEVVMEDEVTMDQKLMPLMLLENNSLDKILSPIEFAEVDSFLRARASMNLSMLNVLKPAAVQIMLAAFIAPKNVSPQNPGLDMHFQTEAKKAGKEVLGFETVEQQGAILFDSSLQRQKELLLKTVREHERMIRESNELFEQYKRQDLKALEQGLLDNDDYTPQEMNSLIAKRNKNWMEKIPELMAKGSVFMAVGAGHLVGEEGLISLLRHRGYVVRPLSSK